jgi:Leucine Rich repeat
MAPVAKAKAGAKKAPKSASGAAKAKAGKKAAPTKKSGAKKAAPTKKAAPVAKKVPSKVALKEEKTALDELVESVAALSLDESEGELTVGNEASVLSEEGSVGRLAVAVQAHADQLRDLVLWFNNIGDPGAAELSVVLPSLSHLRTLNLDNNNIGDPGADAVCKALRGHKLLEELSFCDNKITDSGVNSVRDLLVPGDACCCRLSTLHLSKTPITDLAMLALTEVLQKTESLTNLHMGDCDSLSNGGLGMFAAAIPSNFTLRELHINSSKFEVAGHAKLAAALESNVTLVKLSTRVTNESATPYGKLKSMRLVDLKWNDDDIYHDDAAPVAEMLKVNPNPIFCFVHGSADPLPPFIVNRPTKAAETNSCKLARILTSKPYPAC